jgi:hypothetical protein
MATNQISSRFLAKYICVSYSADSARLENGATSGLIFSNLQKNLEEYIIVV